MGHKIPIDFFFEGKYYRGSLIPTQNKTVAPSYQLFLNEKFCGVLSYRNQKWEGSPAYCNVLAETIGNQVMDRL